MSDRKPLMRWMDSFEKELKKRGGSYKTVDPVDALKMYYKGVDPKKAATQLKESRSEFDVDASPMIRKYIEQGKGIVASANSTLGGNSKFVVMKRPTAMGRAGQDQFMMATISDPKRGRIKMFSYHGTHPSKDGAMKMGKSRKLAESVKLEEKKDPRMSIVSKKVTKLADKERDLLASAINMSGGSAGAPMANRANLDRFNDGVIIPAMTFLRKNMSSLTPEGKKLGKKILKVLGEAVELDEGIVSDKMYRASHGKKPNPNETGGWYFGFTTHPDDVMYQSPNKMKYKDAKKEAEKIAKEKGHKKVYVMASYDPELNEMKLTPKKMAFSLGRKAQMSGKRREPIKDNRLKALLKTVDDSKTRNAMNKEWLRGWDQQNLKDDVQIDEMSAKAHYNKMKAQGKIGRGGRVVTPIDRNRFPNREREGLEGPFRNRKTSLIYYYDKKAGKYYDPQSDMYLDVKDVMDSVEEGLRQDLKNLKKDEGLRQAMSGPRETPAQKRKRKEKDNFDLYKKRQKRSAALRGDKSSRKLTPGQEKHYRQTVNLSQIKALSGVKKESVEEAMADRKVVSTPSLGSMNAPSSNFRMNLPPTGKMKKQMQQIMKKDASYRRKMSKLVQKSETQKDGTITLHFATARKRTSFQKLLHQGIKEGICEQTFKKKAVDTARAASQQKIDMIQKKIDALKQRQSGQSQLDDIKKKQAANLAHKAEMEKKLAASKARIAALRKQLKDDRDYKKEYENYHSKPEQRANRSKRVLARREMIKNGRAAKGDGKDVDHKDGNPQNNSPSNLRMMSVNANRGRNNNKNEEHGAGDEGTNALLKKYRKDTPGQNTVGEEGY